MNNEQNRRWELLQKQLSDSITLEEQLEIDQLQQTVRMNSKLVRKSKVPKLSTQQGDSYEQDRFRN